MATLVDRLFVLPIELFVCFDGGTRENATQLEARSRVSWLKDIEERGHEEGHTGINTDTSATATE